MSALVLAGCAGGESGTTVVSGQPVSLEELSRSASTSAEATSGRFAFDMELAFPGADEALSFSGEGAFDKASERASFAVDMSAFAQLLGGFFNALGGSGAKDAPDFDDPGSWKIEVVQDGPVSYVHFPAVSKRLPDGKSWIRSDGKRVNVDGFELGELEQFAGNDPRELLDVLRAAGGAVETVGTEDLRGVETTHYRVTIDPADYAKLNPSGSGEPALAEQLTAQPGLAELPVDVWLDAEGLVRKLTLSVSATQAGSSDAGSASMSFELWDYGEDVHIDVPPAADVVDASALD